MAKTRQRQTETPLIRYLISRSSGGNLLIEIPADWKVTFAQVNPDRSNTRYENHGAHCVRVWEGEKLRAVFPNSIGLRDLSIPCATEVRRETGSSTWESDSEGNFEKSVKVEVDSTLMIEPAYDQDEVPF